MGQTGLYDSQKGFHFQHIVRGKRKDAQKRHCTEI